MWLLIVVQDGTVLNVDLAGVLSGMAEKSLSQLLTDVNKIGKVIMVFILI